MNIEEFKKKNKPKKTSKLKKFEREILELHQDKFSLKSIVLYLQKNEVNTTFQNVSKFIKSKENTPIFKSPPKKENRKVEKSEEVESVTPFKLERKGKDLEIKAAPSWATD